MRCVFCGEEIGGDNSLCEWCGRRQGESPFRQEIMDLPEAQAPETSSIPSGGWTWVLLKGDPLMLALFVIIGSRSLLSLLLLFFFLGPWVGFLGVIMHLLCIAAFPILLSRRFWAWLVLIIFFILSVALTTRSAIAAPQFLPFIMIPLLLFLAVDAFIIVVLLAKRHYFI
jgi:hypothetical protein